MKTKRAANQNVPSTTGVRTSTMNSRVNKRGQTASRQGGHIAVQGTSPSDSSHTQSSISTRQSGRRSGAAAATATQGLEKIAIFTWKTFLK